MESYMGKLKFSLEGKRVWVAGHRGMIGSALVRRLMQENCTILSVDRNRLDLRDQKATDNWMNEAKPEVVFLAAATVGGILANKTLPAEFLFNNLVIETNVIHSAYRAGTKKLMFLGSNCTYPTKATQPILEECLLTGRLEPTNQWYAVAKIAGIKLCQAYRRQYGCDFVVVQPASAYGPGDNFSEESSHVISGLMKKAHESKINNFETMHVWGTGTPFREYIYVDDLADALIFLIKFYSEELHINVGTGAEVSISALANLISETVGYRGKIEFDQSKPDGMKRKLLSSETLKKLGWKPKTDLNNGLKEMYAWYLDSLNVS